MAAPTPAAKRANRAEAAAVEMNGSAAVEEEEGEGDQSSSEQSVLPGLPDHLAQLCLSPVLPRVLYAVCRSWRRLLYSSSFPPFLSLYALLDDTTSNTAAVSFSSYAPISGHWEPLPSPPLPSPPPLLLHPSFLSRRLPLQSVAAAGRLVLVAASTASLLPALHRPVVFDPADSPPRWLLGPPFPLAPRRWCAAGAAQGRVFIAGGVGSGYDPALARSCAVWDPSSNASWEALPPLRDGRFSREAVEAVCSGGKVCMVNLRGRGPKDGAVYDLRAKRWEEMPPGMLAGWKGPAAAASNGEKEIYVVDEQRGILSVYEWGSDRWKTVVESERLKGVTEMAAGGGKVCVVVEDGEKVVVVDVTKEARGRSNMWVVEAPAGKRVVALHVLPRMSRPDSSPFS